MGRKVVARRILGDDEAALWQTVMRDVAPLRSRRREVPYGRGSSPRRMSSRDEVGQDPAVPAGGKATRMVTVRLVTLDRPTPQKTRPSPNVGIRAPGLDDTQWRRLSRGQMIIDARLDLHGYILQEAFDEFLRFMQRSRVMGWRCVEVVTGLGSGARGGSIRRELPLWLQRGDIAPMVLGVVHSHRGNQGALRVLLRKKR